MQPGKVLEITIAHEVYRVQPDGQSMLKNQLPREVDVATGQLVTSTGGFRPLLPGDPQLMLLLFIYCLAVVVLALYLILSGVVTLTRPAAGARLHLAYSGIKLGLIAVEIALSVAFFNSVHAKHYHAITPFDTTVGMNGVITTSVMQAIYPAALLLIFIANPKLRRMETPSRKTGQAKS